MRPDRTEQELTLAAAAPGACPFCGGTGWVWECIDRERYDVQVPCYTCRIWCIHCNDYVARAGHTCMKEER